MCWTYIETNPFIAQIAKISNHIMNKYEKINWSSRYSDNYRLCGNRLLKIYLYLCIWKSVLLT